MAETLLVQHLKQYIKDAMIKKIRLETTLGSYQVQLEKMVERVVDETDLQGIVESNGDAAQIASIEKRLQKDQDLKGDVISIIEEIINNRSILVDDIQHHLVELSNISLEDSGFIAHSLNGNYEVEIDDVKKAIMFENKDGQVDIPIATNEQSWADGSQLSILDPKIDGGN